MDKHYSMTVNNIKVETLNPNNIIAKLYSNNYDSKYKIELIEKINKHYLKKYEHCVSDNITKNMILNFTVSKNKRYRIHRYNPLVNNMAIFTRKRSSNYNDNNHDNNHDNNDNTYSLINNMLPNFENIKHSTNARNTINKEIIKSAPAPAPAPAPIHYHQNRQRTPLINRSRFRINVMGRNNITLKKLFVSNNKLRILSQKYFGNKRR